MNPRPTPSTSAPIRVMARLTRAGLQLLRRPGPHREHPRRRLGKVHGHPHSQRIAGLGEETLIQRGHVHPFRGELRDEVRVGRDPGLHVLEVRNSGERPLSGERRHRPGHPHVPQRSVGTIELRDHRTRVLRPREALREDRSPPPPPCAAATPTTSTPRLEVPQPHRDPPASPHRPPSPSPPAGSSRTRGFTTPLRRHARYRHRRIHPTRRQRDPTHTKARESPTTAEPQPSDEPRHRAPSLDTPGAESQPTQAGVQDGGSTPPGTGRRLRTATRPSCPPRETRDRRQRHDQDRPPTEQDDVSARGNHRSFRRRTGCPDDRSRSGAPFRTTTASSDHSTTPKPTTTSPDTPPPASTTTTRPQQPPRPRTPPQPPTTPPAKPDPPPPPPAPITPGSSPIRPLSTHAHPDEQPTRSPEGRRRRRSTKRVA